MMVKNFPLIKSCFFFLFLNILGCSSSFKKDISNLQSATHQDEYVSIARVEKDGKVGYVNGWGEEVLPPEFDEGSYGYQLLENRITVRKGENWFIYDIQGNLLLDLKDKYKHVGIFGDDLIYVSKNDIRIWDADSTGYLFNFEELNFIDLSGEEKVKIKHNLSLYIDYPSNIRYKNGYLRLAVAACERCANKLIGFADKNGEIILEPKFFPSDNGHLLNEGLLFSADGPGYYESKDNKARYGFINIKGEWAIEPTYLWNGSSRFVDGAVIVDSTIVKDDPNNKSTLSNTFLINHQGKRVFPRDVQVMRNTSIIDSIVIVTKYFGENLKFALAKTDGSFITDFKFDFINSFYGSGHYASEIGAEHLYINKEGKIVNWELTQSENRDNTIFSALSRRNYYVDGLACIYLKDNQTAVIDMDGHIIMPASDKFPQFEGGIIKVMLSHANSPQGLVFQYYDRKGKPIQFKEYDKMFEFRYLRL